MGRLMFWKRLVGSLLSSSIEFLGSLLQRNIEIDDDCTCFFPGPFEVPKSCS